MKVESVFLCIKAQFEVHWRCNSRCIGGAIGGALLCASDREALLNTTKDPEMQKNAVCLKHVTYCLYIQGISGKFTVQKTTVYRKNSCISHTFLLKFWAQNHGCG